MNERREQFAVGERPRLEVSLPSGDVRIVAGPPGTIEVVVRGSDVERFVMEQRGDTVVIGVLQARSWRRTSFDVLATVPVGTDVEVKLASADLGIDVDVGSLRASVTSGDLRACNVAEGATVKVASGDVRLGDVGGRLHVAGASGDVLVGACADVEISVASGDIHVRRADGRVEARTAAGDVRVGTFTGRHFACKTLSGDVYVGVPPGRTLDVDVHTLSGEVRSEFVPTDTPPPAGERASIQVKSLSGDVVLGPAGD